MRSYSRKRYKNAQHLEHVRDILQRRVYYIAAVLVNRRGTSSKQYEKAWEFRFHFWNRRILVPMYALGIFDPTYLPYDVCLKLKIFCYVLPFISDVSGWYGLFLLFFHILYGNLRNKLWMLCSRYILSFL